MQTEVICFSQYDFNKNAVFNLTPENLYLAMFSYEMNVFLFSVSVWNKSRSKSKIGLITVTGLKSFFQNDNIFYSKLYKNLIKCQRLGQNKTET